MIAGELVTIIVSAAAGGGFLGAMLYRRLAGTAERAAKAETAAENRQNALSDVRRGSKSHGQTVGVSVVR